MNYYNMFKTARYMRFLAEENANIPDPLHFSALERAIRMMILPKFADFELKIVIWVLFQGLRNLAPKS